MKKRLLVIALVLVIACAMLAGTMSQYVKTSSVSVTQEFKHFVFTTSGASTDSMVLDIAPGETKDYSFTISNNDAGQVSETDMAVDLVAAFTAGDVPDGLHFTLTSPSSPQGYDLKVYPSLTAFETFKANMPETKVCHITATWTDGTNDIAYQGLWATFTLNLTARQAAAAPTVVANNDKVYNPISTGWWKPNGIDDALDAEVQINFDKINIGDITAIRFTFYDAANNVLGTKTSTGANLVTLFQDCAQYWGQTAATYLSTTGERWLSTAFKNSAVQYDNGYWVSSPFALTNPATAAKLLVEVQAGSTVYTAEKVF